MFPQIMFKNPRRVGEKWRRVAAVVLGMTCSVALMAQGTARQYSYVQLDDPSMQSAALAFLSEVGSAGRMFSRREIFSADGVLTASASQESIYASD